MKTARIFLLRTRWSVTTVTPLTLVWTPMTPQASTTMKTLTPWMPPLGLRQSEPWLAVIALKLEVGVVLVLPAVNAFPASCSVKTIWTRTILMAVFLLA